MFWLELVPSKWHAILYHCSRRSLCGVQVCTKDIILIVSVKIVLGVSQNSILVCKQIKKLIFFLQKLIDLEGLSSVAERCFIVMSRVLYQEWFWVPVKNGISELWIGRSDALPPSHTQCWAKPSLAKFMWHVSCVLLGPAKKGFFSPQQALLRYLDIIRIFRSLRYSKKLFK